MWLVIRVTMLGMCRLDLTLSRVEGTDMLDQSDSDSVRDVQTADMSDQSQVHHAEVNDTSVSDVQMASYDQFKVDVSDQSQVHHAEIK